MEKEEFVEAIRSSVINTSVTAVESILDHPPGRTPDKQLVELSEWFNEKNPQDKNMILNIVKKCSEITAFGFLCVLDGVRAIESNEQNGQLLLYFESDGKRTLLNDSNEDYLHDLL